MTPVENYTVTVANDMTPVEDYTASVANDTDIVEDYTTSVANDTAFVTHDTTIVSNDTATGTKFPPPVSLQKMKNKITLSVSNLFFQPGLKPKGLFRQ